MTHESTLPELQIPAADAVPHGQTTNPKQVQAHVASDHPDLVETYTREKISEIAEVR
jgi:hypothetical protein